MDKSFLNYSFDDYGIFNTSFIDYDYNKEYGISSFGILCIVLNILTFLLGISLNIAVIVGICNKSYEKSTWDVIFIWYCLQNISVILIDDIAISVHLTYWYLPHWMCSAFVFFKWFFTGSTAITLSSLAFSNLVFHKDISKRWLPAEIFLIVSSIVVAAIVSIPSAIYSEAVTIRFGNTLTVCRVDSVPAYSIACYVLFYCCPVAATIGMTVLFPVLSGSRGNNKARVVIVRVLIPVIYIVCWSPKLIFSFLLEFGDLYGISYLQILWGVFSWFVTLGCCLSPFVVLILDTTVRQVLCRKRANGDVDETRLELTKN